MIHLSQRLSAVAAFAENGRFVADVGTDHGYIPVYLAQKGTAQRIIASDINEGPLNRARISAEEYGVEDKIEFRLTDGLRGISGADTVLIAGMGGDTITGILKDAPWVKNGTDLVLQPQSKQPELLEWLRSEGFSVCDGRLVLDAGKMYIVLLVRWVGGELPQLSPAEGYGIAPCLKNRDELTERYLTELYNRSQRIIAGLSSGNDPDIVRLGAEKALCEDIERILEEVRKW